MAFFCNFVPTPPFPKYIGYKIQDSRLKAQKKLLESKEVGFKIQDTKKTSLIRGGRIQDSRLRRNCLNPRG